MNKVYPGSITLVILLALSGFIIIYSTQTLEMFLARDICAKRRAYEQTFRLNEILLNYGIALCKEHYTEVIKKCEEQKELIGIIDPWPQHTDTSPRYKGIITLRKAAEQINIQTQLIHNGKIKHVLSCKLERKVSKDQTRYTINSWRQW